MYGNIKNDLISTLSHKQKQNIVRIIINIVQVEIRRETFASFPRYISNLHMDLY